MKIIKAKSTLEMASMAASDFAETSIALLKDFSEINVVFSGAESQGAFHAALRTHKEVEWNRINAFAVDEFYAPAIPKEYRVCAQPERDLYAHLPFKSVNVISNAPADIEEERKRYEKLVLEKAPHISCLGIGISGHLALNEPGGTDFNDPQTVRYVKVCEASKRQLEQDPNFKALGTIPDSGLTITLPILMKARKIIVVVPYAIKSAIVRDFMKTEVTPDFPASILKEQPHAVLYLDPESSALLPVG